MSKMSAGTTDRQFTGGHMLACMLAFFGVVIAVNLTMAWMAGHSWTGLIVKNSYVASQGFNAELEQAREQSERGWSSDLKYESGVLYFELHDKSGALVRLDNAVIAIGRPAFEGEDREHPLQALGGGRYVAKDTLAPGLWALQVRGTTTRGPYRRDSRLVVTSDQAARNG